MAVFEDYAVDDDEATREYLPLPWPGAATTSSLRFGRRGPPATAREPGASAILVDLLMPGGRLAFLTRRAHPYAAIGFRGGPIRP
jgi:hypothetical protein